MASVTGVTVNIAKNVANAVVDLDCDINWSDFDKATNLQYAFAWKLIGDDTGQDGDDGVAGDDPINMGLMFLSYVSANGSSTTHRHESKTIAWSNLNEDAGANDDDEIRAVVTLTPQLPLTVSRESNLVTVN